jgi:catechol 2,3-dioxygenase
MLAGDAWGMAGQFDDYVVPAGDASQEIGAPGPGATGLPDASGPRGGTRETCNWIAAAAGAEGRAATLIDYVPIYAPSAPHSSGAGDPMLEFELKKIGHVVLNVSDLEAAVRFYTEVLGLQVSDRYPDSMVPGGMVFLRSNSDHHGVALVGGTGRAERPNLNHFAFEVGSLDEVFRARAWLRQHGVPIVFEGRRRAGCQIAVEFQDPDGNNPEIYWGLDQIGTGSQARPASEWRQAKTLEDAIANPVTGQRMLRPSQEAR